MRILMTADTVGGVWTYAVDLSRALRGVGVTVYLATMGRKPSTEQRSEADAAGITLAESSYRLEWMTDPWEDVRAAGEWLLALESDITPDVVHLNGYVHGQLPWRAPVVMVGHSCVLSWWRAVKGSDAPADWDRYARSVAAGLHAADRVVAPTAAMLECLRTHYGPLRHSTVIFNGREAGRFWPRAKKDVVFSAGRFWDEAKNLDTLDAAARGLDWPVEVAGDLLRPHGAEARPRHAAALGRLTTSEIAERMGHAAVYALPARYEPFGLSALEAALSGCALVLGDIPSLREVWGDAALFVPPNDVGALHHALKTLLADHDLRRNLAARAARRSLRYSPTVMAAEYVRVYNELVGATSPGKDALLCVS